MKTKKRNKIKRCSQCGKSGDDVTTFQDPYSYEVYGEVIERDFCAKCIQERVWDI